MVKGQGVALEVQRKRIGEEAFKLVLDKAVPGKKLEELTFDQAFRVLKELMASPPDHEPKGAEHPGWKEPLPAEIKGQKVSWKPCNGPRCGAPIAFIGGKLPVDPDGGSHFKTCPDAESFSKKAKKGEAKA
jgi:hypothetical protein